MTATMINRTIVHFDLDSFFVSVERLLDSSLNDKPVIIGSPIGRGVVSSCSYEARKFGVHSAMPGSVAKRLCPDAIFVQGSMSSYSKYSKMVSNIIEEESPIVEKASIDEHYINITGMDRYVKNSVLWSQELRQKIIRETGLPISYGLSINKTVSKIATGEGKPNGEMNIEAGTEKQFLAPLSIKKIPGIGEKSYLKLKSIGLEYVRDIQELPIDRIKNLLGKHGQSLWRKANGIDNNIVGRHSKQKSMSTERTFAKDSNDNEMLKRKLITMVESLAFDLRKSKRVAGCITLKIRDSNFKTYTFQSSIDYTAADHTLIDHINNLFNKNFSNEFLVRLIGVRFSNLIVGQTQISLFDDTEEMINLYQSLDKIRVRYGEKSVMRSIGISTSNETGKLPSSNK